jgi:phosphoglycerate dehydrogenase-like enzyme
MSQQVVLVGAQDYFFDPVAEAVKAKGCAVVRYRAPAEFLAATRPLAEASVLYAVGYCPVTREMMAAAPRLRAVISPWTGTEGFDERAATEFGILVGNGQVPENAESMAEATVLMILACIYDLDGTRKRFRDSVWALPHLTARMLKGKRVGLLGYGAIARGVIQRLAGWGVDFLATTRHPPAKTEHPVRFLPLDDMLASSDVICMLAPLTDETRGMLGRRELALMKRGSILIGISRGGIIDEAPLIELAHAGHFGAIGLDVYGTEPLPADSPIRALPNAVLTPHSIGLTQESRRIQIEAGVVNVANVLDGRPPVYVCNPQALARWRPAQEA